MKTIEEKSLLFVIFISMALITFNACTKENNENDNGWENTNGNNNNGGNGNDNNIGIEFNMRNNSEELHLLKVDSVYHHYLYNPDYNDFEEWYYSGMVCFDLNYNNNFEVGYYVRDEYYDDEYHHVVSIEKCAIASVGSVNGLSYITTLPQSGWTDKVAARPCNGYVIKYNARGKSHYARFYVVDWLLSTEGGILGVTIRYQDHWKTE